MKKRLPLILIILVFIVGLGVLIYPVLSEFINARNHSSAVAGYSDAVNKLSEIDYQQLLDQAQQYNEDLSANQYRYDNTEEANLAYESNLRLSNSDVMGYIEIPKIDVKLPFYHGTDQAVLQVGVGHLQGSSLPVGGISSHAVLSGHRGLPSAKLFTNLDQIELGDTFTIYTLNMMLTYQVDQIEVVEPEEAEGLNIVPGGDYITLVTCTPYGVNTHRLLVRGVRIANPVVPETETIVPVSNNRYYDNYLLAILLAALIVLIIILGFLLRRRPRQKTVILDTMTPLHVQCINGERS